MSFFLAIVVVVILWSALLGIIASVMVDKTLKKYKKIRNVQCPPEWQAFIRNDFNKWDERNIKVGCYLRLPFKVVGLLFILVNLVIMVYLKKSLPAIGSKYQAVIVLLSGHILQFIFNYDQKFVRQKITTPIVITNHTCWFDIFYLAQLCYVISFVSKAQVQKVPLIGTVGNYLQNIWLNRKDANAREKMLQIIKERIQSYNRQPELVNPLLIFPQGTTSNGRSIMRFKIGAFNDRARITMFGLQYQCKGFDMGMDEINPLEHVIISLCLSPKLTVRKIIMEPLPDETSKEYMNRCQQELSRLTGFQIYDTGYTEKCKFKEMRYGKKQN